MLFVLCTALAACATLGKIYGITRNFRADGLAVLDVHVIGPPSCGTCSRIGSSLTAPVEGASVTIRGPRGASVIDTLSLPTDLHGQALFEGVKPGGYVMEIKPPPGFQIPVQRLMDLPANAKRSVKYRLGGMMAFQK